MAYTYEDVLRAFKDEVKRELSKEANKGLTKKQVAAKVHMYHYKDALHPSVIDEFK